MSGRPHILLRALPLWGVALIVACSQTTRYRVLNFFFDGVPPPGAASSSGAAEARARDADRAPAAPAARQDRTDRGVVVYAHPPYRNNRCGTCHNPQDGQLYKTAREGLCLPCHASLTREPAYVHGPAAVNACLFCHHHHSAPYPKVLLYDATQTCLRCHDAADLTEGQHHATAKEESCVACHDPHGGNNRFFIKEERQTRP